MDANMQLTINSFRQLFPDKIFSPTFPWFLVKSLTFPCPLSNSLTFPGFYRAMRCKRGLCCHAVSVCPSVTFVDHVKTNKHIFKIVSPSGSNTILVFPYQRECWYSDRNPLTGASNARGYDKITIFSQISRSISETVIVRWAHAARQFVSIEFSFYPYNI